MRERKCLGGCPRDVPAVVAHMVPPHAKVTDEQFAYGHGLDW